MGCCLSKTQDSVHTPKPLPPPLQNHHPLRFSVSDPHHHRAKAPLSPPVEEETVKEVLSETPSTKPTPIAKINEPNVPKIEEIEEEKKTPESPVSVSVSASLAEADEDKKKELFQVHVQAEFSEEFSSEICTASESISTTTTFTTNTEKRGGEDEDGEVQQRLLHRSPSKIPKKRTFPSESATKHERGRKSPARGPDPSPGKRNYGTDVGQTCRRRVSESNLNRPRRDPGECSGRRSRSPATRVNAGTSRPTVGRSPSRRSGRSPARAPAVPQPEKEKTQKAEEPNEGNPPANESIENPLVSLECFIFL